MPEPPFPDWVEPMAATLTQDRFDGPEWIFERKLDGLRQHVSQVGDRFDQVVERIRERSRQVAQMNNLPFEIGEG